MKEEKCYHERSLGFCPLEDDTGKDATEKTFRVDVNAYGWKGNFTLPERYFKELSSYLTERASI